MSEWEFRQSKLVRTKPNSDIGKKFFEDIPFRQHIHEVITLALSLFYLFKLSSLNIIHVPANSQVLSEVRTMLKEFYIFNDTSF